MPERTVASWTSLISGYCHNGLPDEGISTFAQMLENEYPNEFALAAALQAVAQKSNFRFLLGIHSQIVKSGHIVDSFLQNSLIGAYAKSGVLVDAVKLLEKFSSRDVVSWTSVISGSVLHGLMKDALLVFFRMQEDGVMPNEAGLICDIFIQNALIDMYGRSGRLNLAERVFEEMPEKDLSSWNSLIAAYGINGNGRAALQAFAELEKSSSNKPNSITFTNILSACSHSGLVEEGYEIFNSMMKDYGIEPRMEHFVSMVDLLGRSGKLEEAEAFVNKMPVTPVNDVWFALLGACGSYGNVGIAERVAEKLSILDPKGKGWRVALSNIYASRGQWDKAAKVRAQLRQGEEMRKEGGWSIVEVEGEMFRFMVNDTRHPESEVIYRVVSEMMKHIRDDVIAPC
ncbi:hypothetical protein COLO4_08372 [Corchorus olitorius]|uniref:Pentatricopeptide repeat-containing protein n=1 Tax=Corchorus olitorius TaxID=93759 RepID=A0A1R3KG45_9ROSI|nr:hypothetical protein COLO4_08372 [Corchorus olitorius]